MQLKAGKCDLSLFNENMDKINEHQHAEDVLMKNLKDHCIALDHYLDKYQPVRMQQYIYDSLSTCLKGDERRRHELFNEQKISKLYKIILRDDGEKLSILELIDQLTAKAR